VFRSAYPIARGLVHERRFQTEPVAHRLDCEAGGRSAGAKVQRGTSRRCGGSFRGSLLFIVLHLVLVIAWLLVNSGKIPGHDRSTLTVFVTRSDCCRGGSHSLQFHTHASEPHDAPRGASGPPELQVDLLAEKEITKLLQIVRAICGKWDFKTSWRIRRSVSLARPLYESLSQTLEDRLPGHNVNLIPQLPTLCSFRI